MWVTLSKIIQHKKIEYSVSVTNRELLTKAHIYSIVKKRLSEMASAFYFRASVCLGTVPEPPETERYGPKKISAGNVWQWTTRDNVLMSKKT